MNIKRRLRAQEFIKDYIKEKPLQNVEHFEDEKIFIFDCNGCSEVEIKELNKIEKFIDKYFNVVRKESYSLGNMSIHYKVNIEDLIQDDEVLMQYILDTSYSYSYCIAPKGTTDIGGALEMTLHRLIENNVDTNIMDVYEMTPEDEDEQDYTYIDLDYYLTGRILRDSWKEISDTDEIKY